VIDPFIVIAVFDGGHAEAEAQVMGGEEEILEDVGGFDVGRDADEHAQEQGVVDDGLVDVEDLDLVLSEDPRERGSEAGAVIAGDVEEEDVLHNSTVVG
jgi:hypothetical protein